MALLQGSHLLFLLFMFCACHSSNFFETEVIKCNKHYSSDFLYEHFYNISDLKSVNRDVLYFEFQVKAPSDAHIKFSERPFPDRNEAAYEIVIGAGNNTFSFIRRKEIELSKRRLDTPGILSSEEFRSFWIRINKFGEINVGKHGEEFSFMAWNDYSPLDIKYFSFSSWNNISAEWEFNCGKTKGRKDLSIILKSKIKEIILEEYNFVRGEQPNYEESSRYGNLYTHLTSSHVSVDDERSILVVDGILSLLWEDRRLAWSPEDFGNIMHMEMNYFDTWTPKVINYNSAEIEAKEYAKGISMLRIYSNGTILNKFTVHFSEFCKGINHQKWPYDTSICELQLGFMSPYSSRQIIPMKDGFHFQKLGFDTEWNIESMDVKTKRIPSPVKSLDEWKYPENNCIIFEFSLTRSNNIYYGALKMLLSTICIITLLSFWASALGSVKIGLQCLSLMITSFSLLFSWKIIPIHNSKDLPSVFSVFTMTMHMLWVSIVLSVVLSNFIFLAPLSIPSAASSFIKSKFLTMFFCLPQPSIKVAMCYNRLYEGSVLNKQDLQGYSFSSKECEAQWNWILISTITDRILFCAYIALFSYAFSTF